MQSSTSSSTSRGRGSFCLLTRVNGTVHCTVPFTIQASDTRCASLASSAIIHVRKGLKEETPTQDVGQRVGGDFRNMSRPEQARGSERWLPRRDGEAPRSLGQFKTARNERKTTERAVAEPLPLSSAIAIPRINELPHCFSGLPADEVR